MVIVPRAPYAYLVSHTGTVLRVFKRDDTRGRGSGSDEKAAFIAATVSPSNKWLYVATEDGLLLCIDVATGKLEKTIRDFAVETSGKENSEISGLVHHVNKSLLGGYSNDKSLKRGRLVLWK
jgi:outer membrane protein assembly factor BamB